MTRNLHAATASGMNGFVSSLVAAHFRVRGPLGLSVDVDDAEPISGCIVSWPAVERIRGCFKGFEDVSLSFTTLHYWPRGAASVSDAGPT